ncbi:MAG TPA: ornithine cyclodeaminase family protein [Methylomirabilota bacterium]|nr:ornithine cyclodeaminase family protein [Methylomirabilota bacterium]
MLVLTRADLEALLEVEGVIAAVEEAFRQHARKAIRLLPRQGLGLEGRDVLLLMPCALPALAALGTKTVTVCFENPRRGLPTVLASYLLHDPATGEPLAFMEAGYLTGMRTGAASAAAAKRLARPDSRVVACFGAGTQAAFQLRCLKAVLPIERVEVVSRSDATVRAFAERMGPALGVPVGPAATRAAALAVADVVVTATTSPMPVFDGRDLRPGTHVDAVGAFQPTTRELDTEAIRRARVFVDTYEGAWLEAGDVLLPIQEGAITRAHVLGELADLVTGSRPGRLGPSDITCFKSVGFAAEDAATARLAYDRARAAGRGLAVELYR